MCHESAAPVDYSSFCGFQEEWLVLCSNVLCPLTTVTYPSSPTAPVSSPQLSSECLSHGEMRVSCSSEGDGPQYSWTLDGHPLNNNDNSFGEMTNSITLQKGLSGDLNCTIRNNISSVTVSRIILPCPGKILFNINDNNDDDDYNDDQPLSMEINLFRNSAIHPPGLFTHNIV